ESQMLIDNPAQAKDWYREAGYPNWERIGDAFFDFYSPRKDIADRYDAYFSSMTPEDLEAAHFAMEKELGLIE
ncbi:MAG: hypothetical protein AAFP02_14995, partial [Bacteroidota bacterium]